MTSATIDVSALIVVQGSVRGSEQSCYWANSVACNVSCDVLHKVPVKVESWVARDVAQSSIASIGMECNENCISCAL